MDYVFFIYYYFWQIGICTHWYGKRSCRCWFSSKRQWDFWPTSRSKFRCICHFWLATWSLIFSRNLLVDAPGISPKFMILFLFLFDCFSFCLWDHHVISFMFFMFMYLSICIIFSVTESLLVIIIDLSLVTFCSAEKRPN